MIRLLCFVLAVLASPFKSKLRLEAENAVLRHQLIVSRRRLHGRVRLTNHDRWFFIQLYRWFPSISSMAQSIPYGVQTGYRRIENLAAALKGTNHLPKIVAGVRFKDGIEVLEAPTNRRLIAPHHLNSCIALNQLAKPSCVAARSHGVNLGHAYNIRFCSQHWPITFGAQYGS
jgi:hypothetical protein